jgi:hypothetical protein
MLGISSDIRLGEFHLESPDIIPTFSGESGDGHAWCRVKSTTPVDLSMTFKLYAAGAGPQLYAPVFGTGLNGDYFLSYHRFNEPAPKAPTHRHHIIFREHELIQHTPDALTQNPYLFLHPPDPADTQNWDALYGPEIYARISAHCFAVATSRAKPIRRSLSSRDAAKWISTQYPNATNDVLTAIKNA